MVNMTKKKLNDTIAKEQPAPSVVEAYPGRGLVLCPSVFPTPFECLSIITSKEVMEGDFSR